MVGIFKRIYDWLLSLFWYELPNSLHVSHLITQIQSLLGVCVCVCACVFVCWWGALQPDVHTALASYRRQRQR